jgi:cyclic-di-GMP-binding protein
MVNGSEVPAPPSASPGQEASRLRDEFRVQFDGSPTPAQRIELLSRFYGQAFGLIEAALPRLSQSRLPVSSPTRQAVSRMQSLLDALTTASLALIDSPHSALFKTLGTPLEVALWRVLYGLSRHLMLANLISTPATPGFWFQTHRAYLSARMHRVEKKCPAPGAGDLQTLYARTLVLGALPCAALTAQQWSFAYWLLAQTRAAIPLTDTPPLEAAGAVLWLSPEQDGPPVHLARRTPSGDALTLYADIAPLILELEAERNSLGKSESSRRLPGDLSMRLARITLANVLRHLQQPRKRRFPRRRQSYRATLCCGLPAICEQLNGQAQDPGQLSEWMVVNESPDGFAAMHVSGRPQKVQVGDLVGLRREDDALWSVCIVRWALSENPEHLELGLQMVAPNPISARMATPGAGSDTQYPALLLPATPPIRPLEALAFLPANHPAAGQKHLLVLHSPKTGIREFLIGDAIEQSTSTDIYLIHADTSV